MATPRATRIHACTRARVTVFTRTRRVSWFLTRSTLHYMDAQPLAKLVKLTFTQREQLDRGKLFCSCLQHVSSTDTGLILAGITTVEELLLLSALQLVQRCNIAPPEADSIIDTVCEELAPRLRTLDDPGIAKDLTFTTGDRLLDNCLGGGITTGKIMGNLRSRVSQYVLSTDSTKIVTSPTAPRGKANSACRYRFLCNYPAVAAVLPVVHAFSLRHGL